VLKNGCFFNDDFLQLQKTGGRIVAEVNGFGSD
jgi:hypothetical protein